jgi:hypothetical protein
VDPLLNRSHRQIDRADAVPTGAAAADGGILRDSLRAGGCGRVFALAVVLDVVYQLYVLHFVYPLQSIAVAFLLAIVPYLILRGLVTRAARAMGHGASTHRHA